MRPAGTLSFGGSTFGTSSFNKTPASPWSPPGPASIAKRAQENSGCETSKAESEQDDQAGDVLSRALYRAAIERPAFFGAIDSGADKLLKEYFQHLEPSKSKEEIERLSHQLGSATKSTPELAAFLRFVFESAAKSACPGVNSAMRLKEVEEKPAKHETADDRVLRELLADVTQNKLIELEWAKWSRSAGRYHTERAKMCAFLATEKQSRDDLLEALRDEEIHEAWEEDKLVRFVDWLVVTAAEMRSFIAGEDGQAAVREMEEAEGSNTYQDGADGKLRTTICSKHACPDVSEDVLDVDYFKPNAAWEAKHVEVLKSGNYAALDFPKYNADEEKRVCCDRKPDEAAARLINAHLYIEKHDLAQLKIWVIAKASTLTNANAVEVSRMVLEILKSDDLEGVVKDRCCRELRKSFLDNTDAFVEELFEALATQPWRLPVDRERKTSLSDRRNPEQAFRFLDLPAELRTWVYRAAMVPGEVSLKVCRHHLPYGVESSPTPGLLRVCKLLKHETKDLIFETTFIADALFQADSVRVFQTQLLPPPVLPKLSSLVMVIHYQWACSSWQQLRSMTNLKTLTICAFKKKSSEAGDPDWQALIQGVLESVPAGCSVDFGPRTAVQNQHMQSMMRKLGGFEKVSVVDSGKLQKITTEVEKAVKKGSKSGVSSWYNLLPLWTQKDESK